jgi:phage terminase large subunit-like protein
VIVTQAERLRADDIVLEDKSSGKADGVMNVVEYRLPPDADKVMRLHAGSDRIENGHVFLPRQCTLG